MFGALRLTKNGDIDKYKYLDYGIRFDRRGNFSFPSSGFGRSVIVFGADINSSAKIDHR